MGIQDNKDRIQLILEYKNKKSKSVIKKLVILYEKRLYKEAHKFKRLFESVDDAYGYAVIGLIKGLDRCDTTQPVPDVFSYIYHCIMGEVSNEAGRRRRYNNTTNQLDTDVEGSKSPDETPLDILMEGEDVETMLECLDNLERRVVKMRFWGGLPFWMIGRETGLGRQELAGIYHKALNRLRKNLP